MIYVLMFVAGLFGIALHSLITIRKLNKNIATETYKSIFAKFWRMEWISLTTSIVALGAAIFISNEFLNGDLDNPMPGNIAGIIQYKLMTYVKTTFLIVGYCADSIIYAFLGTAEEKLKRKAKDGGVEIANN